MSTYSINIGTPTESTKVQDLQTFLNKLPDNTAQLISPRDTRDAVFTTWENILIKETTVGSSSIGYIGLDNDTLKAKMLIGKKSYTTQEILDNTLLSSDTDLFIFNGKSDSNPSLQDTKVTLLAGLIPSDYYYAPYIEATKITSPSRIDLSIVNPATAGVIEINASQIELGNSGWVINNSGALYPVIDGQDLGATPSNRIGNIFMSSRIDYANDLSWTVGTTSTMTLTTGGILSIDSISASNIFVDDLQVTTSATAGYVLTSDGIGNAIWSSVSIDSAGVTAGYIIVSDGLGDIAWQSNTSLSSGLDGSVQFSQSGVLSSDSNNFFWDNIGKKLGLNTNTPTTELEVIGSGSFSSSFNIGNNLTVGNTMSSIGVNSNDLVINNSVQLNITGATAGKILTASDSVGNATWVDAPITVTASGSNGAIQLADGLGNFINDTTFRWDNTFSGVLKINNGTDIPEPHRTGIQTDGDLFLHKKSTLGWNSYYNSYWKRIETGYSSFIKQQTGKLNIYTFDTGVGGSRAGNWLIVGTFIDSPLGYNNNAGFEEFTTISNHGLNIGDIIRITGVNSAIDGEKTVKSIASPTIFIASTPFTTPLSVPIHATVEVLTTTPSILINNINKNVGIDIDPVRDLHVNKYMRLEPTSTPPTTPNNGDVYFDNTLNSLMVYSVTGWYKSESKMLYNIHAEDMFTNKNSWFNGLFTQKSKKFISNNRFKMEALNKLDNAGLITNRNVQFNFVLPDTYISGRNIKVKVYWTFNAFVLSTVTTSLQIGITKGPYNSLDASAEYQTTLESIAGGFFHNLPERSFELIFSGIGMTPGKPLSIVILRDSNDTFSGDTYINKAEVYMI